MNHVAVLTESSVGDPLTWFTLAVPRNLELTGRWEIAQNGSRTEGNSPVKSRFRIGAESNMMEDTLHHGACCFTRITEGSRKDHGRITEGNMNHVAETHAAACTITRITEG